VRSCALLRCARGCARACCFFLKSSYVMRSVACRRAAQARQQGAPASHFPETR
jgi:hypothetical protein